MYCAKLYVYFRELIKKLRDPEKYDNQYPFVLERRRAPMGRSFFIIVMTSIIVLSCEIREISEYTSNTSSDIGPDIHNILPVDICPNYFNGNSSLLFPSPKITFMSGNRLDTGRAILSLQNKDENYLIPFFETISEFINKNRTDRYYYTHIQIHTFRGLSILKGRCNLHLKRDKGAYYLKIFGEDGHPQIINIYLLSDDEEGFYNGAKSISQMLFKNELFESAIFDYPETEIRAVAEAFYGKIWDEEDRLDAISYLALLKYNLFLYSPKSDAFAWAMWRTPYDQKEEEKLRRLAKHSTLLGITPCYGVGPGYDIQFSNTRDYSTLLNKFRRLISFGFDRCLVLAFDDTQKTLSDIDKERFSNIADAQIYLANRLYEDIKKIRSDIMLAFVPNDYTTEWAKKDNYLSRISEGLGDKYQIAWTGYYVVSPTITIKDIDEIEAILKQPPVLADNYPVSDLMYGGGAAFLGPIAGREAGIFNRIKMYASNPMRYTISSLIPLGTIADLLWNPYTYEKEKSFKNSIRMFARENRANDIYEFATNLRSSLITKEESPELKLAIELFFQYYEDCNPYYFDMLNNNFFLRFQKIDEILSGAADERFISEMHHWIEKLKNYGQAGEFALTLLKKHCDNEEILDSELSTLRVLIDYLKQDKYRITAEIMNDFLTAAYEKIKRR